MIKQIIILMFLTIGHILHSQTGIQTASPNSGLDVMGKPDDPSTIDGVIPPRITKTQLTTKTGYGPEQTGAVVYVTDTTGPMNSATLHISEPGLHIFDGITWNKINNLRIDEHTGEEVKKILTQGPVNPDQTITSGILEFRLTPGIPPFADANYMNIEIRIAPNHIMTGDIRINGTWTNIGTGSITGSGVGSDGFTVNYTISNRDQWRIIKRIEADGLGQFITLAPHGIPIQYTLYAHRYGGNQGLPKLKSLIINTY